MKKSVLDDSMQIQKLDPQNMMRLVESVPSQCQEARKKALLQKLKINPSSIRSIAICGVGGSAMGGDILATYLRFTLKIPVSVVRDYLLPAWVTPQTLIVSCSYSGNTEETLSTFRQALIRKMKIVVLTSGGILLKEAQKNKLPYFQLPPGVQPRAMVNYSFVTLLTLLENLKWLPPQTQKIEKAISLLRKVSLKYGMSSSVRDNPAKQLAEFFDRKIPVIYAGESSLLSVAYRWKCQFNENSKQMVHVNSIPEMNHNEILAYTRSDLFVKKVSVLLIRSAKYDYPRVSQRFDILRKMISLKTPNLQEVWGEGDSLLSQTLQMIYLGDFISVYLAFLRKIDPTSIELIDQLKNNLKK